MSIVIKIGGCNGSGKTSIVRALLDNHMGVTQYYTPKGKLEAYGFKTLAKTKVYILGSYENICGGMDTISDKVVRLALIEKALSEAAPVKSIIIFEGLITGKTYGAIGEISERPNQKGKWIYAFMDTPFNTCVERVLQRRSAKGNHAEFDPERTMRPTFRAVDSVAKRAASAGHHVAKIDHTKPALESAISLLSFAEGLL